MTNLPKKSFIVGALIFVLAGAVLITALPIGATAQMATYYNGYNAAPRWNKIGNQTVVQGQTMSVSAFAVDDNGDALTYSTSQLPAGSSYDSVSHVFSFTPNYNQLGSFPVTLGVTDNKSAVIYTTFYVNVTTNYGHYNYGGGSASGYYNQAPYFSATNSHYTIYSGNNLRFTVSAVDPEGQTLRYSINGLPAGASFNSVTRAFSWTPESNQRGNYALVFYATDGYATSVPLNITIVVDGGIASGVNQNYYNQNQNYYGSVIGGAAQYYPGYTGGCALTSTAPVTAIAGQVYLYAVRGCENYNYGSAPTYRLTVAPTGAVIDSQTGLLSWSVPKNAVNQQYQFAISVSSGYNVTPVTQTFSVQVLGGEATVNTIVTQPKTVVQYVGAPTQPVTATNYYPNPQNVYVNTGRTVLPVNYQQYTGSAYGAIALPAPSVAISVFNIAVRVSANQEMIVSWDTNKPTTGEVVFGYASQSRGADLDRTILNYDFTTGPLSTLATRHEISLGKLQTNQTYYLRIISRADNQTEISREIIFIPMVTPEGSVVVNQSEGAASAVSTVGSFLVSGGFLFFLLLIVIGLIVYLIVLNRRSENGFTDPQLHVTYDDHEPSGGAPISH